MVRCSLVTYKHTRYQVFKDLGTTVLSEAIKGYNVCLFAYGQTGSGKTYTMMGTPTSIGLTPRICEGLFYSDDSPGAPSSSRIEVSFLEIYNERVRDLLHQSNRKKPYTLRVREHPEKGPYVQGLSQHVVTNYEQVVALLEEGMENRITAATHVHDASSRSHAIFTIQYTQATLEDNLPSEIASKINLVDLAGSERASPNYCKDRLTEGSNINRSLVTLGIVISALAQNSQMSSSCQSINSILSDGDSGIQGSSPSGSSISGSKRQPFVPYRDSILTWLLKDSLGGNSKTIMIATVSPSSSSYNETMSTLRYASNAKNIINKPRVNEDANVKLIRELREEINRLKAMLKNFEMRTMSPSFNEERDGNLSELVQQSELKIEQLTKDWTERWTDKEALMEHYNVDINQGKARVTIDSALPHLIAVDEDILSTGVVIYHLKEGTTNIGSGDHDIVLQGEGIEQDHCIIENNFGSVELRPVSGALCTVNGQEVTDACCLSQGAIIVLGRYQRFRFNHPAEAAVLRQRRSDSQASFLSDCSLDWLDLSGDYSSSKENSLILNARSSETVSEEYQQQIKDLEASYQQQVDEQQKYVEDLKRQIQAAQVTGEKELEQEQSLLNQQIQENQQWLVKEQQRLTVVCQERKESAVQTEVKTYAEVEVQNCVQTEIQPYPEELERKQLVQLELLRKCSLRRAERNIKKKRVKFQLERIVKKQKLFEAKKTLQQLQAACWISEDALKPTYLHVPKVQEPCVISTILERTKSSPSLLSYCRRRSLPFTAQTLPTYSALLKRECKSELVHKPKTSITKKPLRAVSIDCLLKALPTRDLVITPPDTANPVLEKRSIDCNKNQGSAGCNIFVSDPQMSKKRPKMDKATGRSKGSYKTFPTEPPKKKNVRATINTGTKDTKLKATKSLSQTAVAIPRKNTVSEKIKPVLKNDGVKSPSDKNSKTISRTPGQGKIPPKESSTVKTRRNFTTSNTQTKQSDGTSKISTSVDNISKFSHHRDHRSVTDKKWMSTERLNRGLFKSNIQALEHWKEDANSDSSDGESYYSIDSLSSAYASALNEQLRQEERERQKSGRRDSDSEDSQMSQDSLVDREGKERTNKRKYNRYKTIGTPSSPSKSFTEDHNSFPLVAAGSVTTGVSKSFSLDSLADADEVPDADSSDELPAEIFWKIQSPRSLIIDDNQQKGVDNPMSESIPMERSASFYLKLNKDATTGYSDNSSAGKTLSTENYSNISDVKSHQSHQSSFVLHSASLPGLPSEKYTVEPTENTMHEEFSLLVPGPQSTAKTNAHLTEEGKELCIKNNVAKIKPQVATGILKEIDAQYFPGPEQLNKELYACHVKANTSPIKAKCFESKEPDQECTVDDCSNKCSNKCGKSENVSVLSVSLMEGIESRPTSVANEDKQFTSLKVSGETDDRKSQPLGDPNADKQVHKNVKFLAKNCNEGELKMSVKDHSHAIPDDHMKFSKSQDVNLNGVPFREAKKLGTKMKNDTEQVVTGYNKNVTTPLNILNLNTSINTISKPPLQTSELGMQKRHQQHCSNEILSDISTSDQNETFTFRDGFALSTEDGKMDSLNNTTTKYFDQNENVTQARSAYVQMDYLNNEIHIITDNCLGHSGFGPFLPTTLQSDQNQESIDKDTHFLKADDQVHSVFETARLMPQYTIYAVGLDKIDNVNKLETRQCQLFEEDIYENNVADLTEIVAADNTKVGTTFMLDNNAPLDMEHKRHEVSTEQSKMVTAEQPNTYSCHSEEHGKLSRESSLGSTMETGPGKSNMDTYVYGSGPPSLLSNTSSETVMEVKYPPVNKMANCLSDEHTQSGKVLPPDLTVIEYNNPEREEGSGVIECFSKQDILFNHTGTSALLTLSNKIHEVKTADTIISPPIQNNEVTSSVKRSVSPDCVSKLGFPSKTSGVESYDLRESLGSSEDSTGPQHSLYCVKCVETCNLSGNVSDENSHKEKNTIPEQGTSDSQSSCVESSSIQLAEGLCCIQKLSDSQQVIILKAKPQTPLYSSSPLGCSHDANICKPCSAPLENLSIPVQAIQVGTPALQNELNSRSGNNSPGTIVSGIITTNINPGLCNTEEHCEEVENQCHESDISELQTLKEGRVKSVSPKTENSFNEQINQNDSEKICSDKDAGEPGSSKATGDSPMKTTWDSATSEIRFHKPFRGCLTECNEDTFNCTDFSFKDACIEQENSDCVNETGASDIVSSHLILPYYEAVMENKHFSEPKQVKAKVVNAHDYTEGFVNISEPAPAQLSSSKIVNYEDGKMFSLQDRKSPHDIPDGAGHSVKNNEDTPESCMLTPKIMDAFRQAGCLSLELNGEDCSCSTTGRQRPFQEGFMEESEQMHCNSGSGSNQRKYFISSNKTQDESVLVQQKASKRPTENMENLDYSLPMDYLEDKIVDFSSHNPEPATCSPIPAYTSTISTLANHLPVDELSTDKSPLPSSSVLATVGLNNVVSNVAETNDSFVKVRNKGRENEGIQDKNLAAMADCGEDCAESSRSLQMSSGEENIENSTFMVSSDVTSLKIGSLEHLSVLNNNESNIHKAVRTKLPRYVCQVASSEGNLSHCPSHKKDSHSIHNHHLCYSSPKVPVDVNVAGSPGLSSVEPPSSLIAETPPQIPGSGGWDQCKIHATSHVESQTYAPNTDCKVHRCFSDHYQSLNCYGDAHDIGDACAHRKTEDYDIKALTKINSSLFQESSQDEETSIEELVENNESLHFFSSDINPFVHSWQQEVGPKSGWRKCSFNSASDISCSKLQVMTDKLIRCSSVDEGLNAHNSPFNSHLSSYANAKPASSTISSIEENYSRPDLNSLDGSQDHLLRDIAAIQTRNETEFVGGSESQVKFEDYSQLDEIMILYTSESETCNEADRKISYDYSTQTKPKYRRNSRHQRSHTDVSSSRQMRNRNLHQKPVSWSNVQNMSLHLSQLLQETSELLGNLSQHNSENMPFDATRLQTNIAQSVVQKLVRDSSTQTSEDKSIQTDSSTNNGVRSCGSDSNNFQHPSEINVVVKVIGADTYIPPSTCLTSDSSSGHIPKAKTQSLPNLEEFRSCKKVEQGMVRSPKVQTSTPFLNGSKDMSSRSLPGFSPYRAPVSTTVNKGTDEISSSIPNSPSSSVIQSSKYCTFSQGNTTMVDRASSPILTLKASKKSVHNVTSESNSSNQYLLKAPHHRKRKERGKCDQQLTSSQTETDSESISSYDQANTEHKLVVLRCNSLQESPKKRVATHEVQRYMSEGCILRDNEYSFVNQRTSNIDISSFENRHNRKDDLRTSQPKKMPRNTSSAVPPWERLQSLEHLPQMSHPVLNRHGQSHTRAIRKELGSDDNDLCSGTIGSNTSYVKNNLYSASQMSGFDFHLQEDSLSVVESECNTDVLLGQEPSLGGSQKPQNYSLQDLPMHNKFSNWSGVTGNSSRHTPLMRSSPDLIMKQNLTKTDASQVDLDFRSQEIERLQRERVAVMSAIHLEMNPQPLTVQLAEAKLSYGIGETDALLRVIQTGKPDGQETVSIKKQLYERHMKVIENLRKEREERLQNFRRSRSLSPQKQLSASQISLSSLKESELPSRRREYLQQLRKDVVDSTRIQEPKRRLAQCPSEIEVMLKDYQKAREEAKSEIARARDKLRERAEVEKRRLLQSTLPKEDTKMKTLVSTSTLFTNSSLSLSSGPTSGYNSGVTATPAMGGKGSCPEVKTLLVGLDLQSRSGRSRSAVRNCHLVVPAQNASLPVSPDKSQASAGKSPSTEALPSHEALHYSSSPGLYQELTIQIQASAMAEVMAACSYDVRNLFDGQASAGWIYQTTEKDVLVYYKAFSSPTKHSFMGAGVIRRPLHEVWSMVKDVTTRRLYDQSILAARVHQRVGSNIQLVHVMMDTSLCYLKQPRDFCCITVESKEEKCSSLCFQSLYNESMPRPNRDAVRGEIMPSAWILQPDDCNGETVTRVIYMLQVDLGAPAIPSRLLSLVSKRQPLVIASLARFLSR
ncbi:stAR-related lipid transfer protein 9 isoform X2 [Hyperolius riggenbachi]|uniref:stAR-related lipid transfer protein 9 isoform X2 n=1 Tax=Hyperolius riggenbachi TaxID=752182 RepID=UPI0035A38994